MTYSPTIGLEIHVELKTRTKMFCDSLNDPDETHPNINVCPICMAHPGTLPVINRDAVNKVIQVGLALGGEISEFSQFDRKNYFYPDLPKGYQISQYQSPLVKGGYLEIEIADEEGDKIKNPKSKIKNTNQKFKKVRIQRIHLEEDTGRLIHDPKTKTTLIDFNRAGIPLMELVTEPDCHSAEEARLFAGELKLILQYLGASDADMEKGEMRIEANVSLRPLSNASRIEANESRIFENHSGLFGKGSGKLGTKVEIKNINSFRFVERAIAHEIKRQEEVLERGETIRQETRGWDEKTGTTVSQRSKEESHDYRYFPEPDLPPLKIERALADELRATLPELPQEKLRRFRDEFKIEAQLAQTLVSDKPLAGFFEAAVSELQEWLSARGKDTRDTRALQLAANYLTTDVVKLLTDHSASIQETLITPENFAELITYLYEGRISSRTAKEVLAEMFASGADPSVVIEERKLWQISETGALGAAVEKIVSANPKAVADYRAGKTAALQFLVGQIMKEVRDANPETARKLLEARLNFPEKT